MAHTVLVVDDDPRILRVLSSYLASDGYVVITADGGESARLEFSQYKFDVVILDLMMPDMDGLSLCRWVRAQESFGKVPILVFTARDDMKALREATAAGATAFIPKPFSLSGLSEAVAKALTLNSRDTGNPPF